MAENANHDTHCNEEDHESSLKAPSSTLVLPPKKKLKEQEQRDETSISQPKIRTLFPPINSTSDSLSAPIFLRGENCQIPDALSSSRPPPLQEEYVKRNPVTKSQDHTSSGNINSHKEENDQESENLIFHHPSTFLTLKNEKTLGVFIVTTRRLIFAAKNRTEKKFDCVMNASCLTLHAIQEEEEGKKVYCQIQTVPSNGEETNTMGVTSHKLDDGREVVIMHPTTTSQDIAEENENDTENLNVDEDVDLFELSIVPCAPSVDDKNMSSKETEIATSHDVYQQIFDALSFMVSLNPIPCEDDDAGEMSSMLDLIAMANNHGNMGIPTNDDDMVYKINHNNIHYPDDGYYCPTFGNADVGGVSSERYNAELKRLDNLLEIPSQNEQDSCETGLTGQFDDAEETYV
eukprot:CAMPEP_0184864804 /NCGR_PEP_ID=MMETSP0580-20130426/16098_1 /TAXON_ID=1118495 /ORGANISM="Dactyliosolen fragilissimus" /LENGTH=403 /DNA_ID=CAMNT_0027363723 /DNA_START=71 /DNA_END=1279 /DNA_ORIENTATION=-